jgi:hypothetical protein
MKASAARPHRTRKKRRSFANRQKKKKKKKNMRKIFFLFVWSDVAARASLSAHGRLVEKAQRHR